MRKSVLSQKSWPKSLLSKVFHKTKNFEFVFETKFKYFRREVEEGCLVCILRWINVVQSGGDTCRFSNPRSFDLLSRKLFAFSREIEASLFIYFHVIVSHFYGSFCHVFIYVLCFVIRSGSEFSYIALLLGEWFWRISKWLPLTYRACYITLTFCQVSNFINS